MKKLILRSLSTILSILMLLCMTPIISSAAGVDAITYSFANDKGGFAEGTITLSTESSGSGTYHLYWADDYAALDGYYEIARLNITGTKSTFSFPENIAIPADATKLIAISSVSLSDRTVKNATAVYDIPASKQNPHKSSDKTLSFEALSDTQVDQQSSPFYTYSVEHFKMALENAASRNVDFITTSGDCINNYQNGTTKEWLSFQKIIADSSYLNPIYEANGNHSMKSDREYGLEAFIKATGLGVDDETLGDKPWYEITAKNGDHFIFAALENSDSVGDHDEFSDEQLDWLENTISSYYDDGHRIFVFEHAFFHGYGPGDDKVNHYYSGGLRTTEDFPTNKRFKELFDKYREVFLYTGHSHLDFEYNWNYDNENGKTANMFHIPSTACTTHVTNGSLDYAMNIKNSQCYIVDCYDDMVISNGLNVYDNLIYPQYSYIVYTGDYSHEPAEPEYTEPDTTPESTNMIDVQIENATSYLYKDKAALYFYNNKTGGLYPVDSTTGIAHIPENAYNLTLYRCKEAFNSGAESNGDSVTSYWNKYGPMTREPGQTVFYVKSSSVYNWKLGDIIYPTEAADATEISAQSPSEITDITEATEPQGTENTSKETTGTPDEAESIVLSSLSENIVTIEVLDKTAQAWIFSDTAKLYFYDKSSKQYFPVDSGKVSIPESAKNLTIYRCDGEWGVGNVTDSVTTYWNKWELSARKDNSTILALTGNGSSAWVSSEDQKVDPNASYFLAGYINGKDVTAKTNKFNSDGTFTIELTNDSYVYIISSNGTAYWTNDWLGNNTFSATLYPVSTLSKPDKLFVPSGKATFTLSVNTDNTVSLLYKFEPIPIDENELELLRDTLFGDANSDGRVSVNDATHIQKYVASMLELTDDQKFACDFFGSNNINVKCATMIQKYVASLITSFPNDPTSPVDISTTEKLLSEVQRLLSEDYRYASYVAYSKLKTVYAEYKELGTEADEVVYNEILEMYNNFLDMKEKNDVVIVYYCNYSSWPGVKAYLCNSETGVGVNTLETAQGISLMDTLDSGAKMYGIAVNRSKWDKIIFTNGGGEQTIAIDTPDENYIGCYITEDSTDENGAYIPTMFRYKAIETVR